VTKPDGVPAVGKCLENVQPKQCCCFGGRSRPQARDLKGWLLSLCPHPIPPGQHCCSCRTQWLAYEPCPRVNVMLFLTLSLLLLLCLATLCCRCVPHTRGPSPCAC
jgi:predicted nucleic acid-binding Zn ribbon protein